MKRHIATITIYSYGETSEEAFQEAQSICDEINKKHDSDASIESFEKHEFGKLRGFPMDISKFKK